MEYMANSWRNVNHNLSIKYAVTFGDEIGKLSLKRKRIAGDGSLGA